MQRIKTIFVTAFITLIIVSTVFAVFYFRSKDDYAQEKFKPDSFIQSISDTNSLSPKEKSQLNDQIYKSRQNIITETVQKVSPAVVGINVTEIRQYRDPLSSDPIFRWYFGDRVYQKQVKGLGSGTIISPDGYILTNDHVAGNAVEVIVTMTDGTEYNAKVIGSDKASDICLLKIEAHDLPYVPLGDSDKILIGEWVIALGNPFGLFDINDKPTVTVGVISATGMNLGEANNRYYVNMIQTDAAINGGNSGGPLVNSVGQLIGMNTLIYTARGSSGNVGVGFALPINKIKKVVSELKENGKVDRNFWTGLSIQAIDAGIAKYYNLTDTRGIIITNVVKGSPADKAGLQVADIILQINQYKIKDENTLISVIKEFRTGDTINVKIRRDKQILTKQMKLERYNDQ